MHVEKEGLGLKWRYSSLWYLWTLRKRDFKGKLWVKTNGLPNSICLRQACLFQRTFMVVKQLRWRGNRRGIQVWPLIHMREVAISEMRHSFLASRPLIVIQAEGWTTLTLGHGSVKTVFALYSQGATAVSLGLSLLLDFKVLEARRLHYLIILDSYQPVKWQTFNPWMNALNKWINCEET